MSQDKFMAAARKRFEQAQTEEKDIRSAAEFDLRMVAGGELQWDPHVLSLRRAANRPCLSFNREHTFSQQIANEVRQLRGEVKFVSGEPGDDELVKVMEGLVRQIQYSSQASVAFETAGEYSAAASFGYYGLRSKYSKDGTCKDLSRMWEQDLEIYPIFDPFSIYGMLIPACYGRPATWAFEVEELTKEEYETTYPNDDISDWDWATKHSGDWVREDRVRVARYYWIEYDRKTVYRLADGSVVESLPEGMEAEDEREVVTNVVKSCIINGVAKLKGTETTWPGKRIPLFPVLGKLLFVDGKPTLQSVVRHQHAAQQLLNSYKSRIAETLGTAPIQPYLVPKGSIAEEDKATWARMNTANLPYLEYLPTSDLNGQPVPPPQRQVFEPPIGALSAAAAQEIDDMKATAGIYDASMGAQGNETSGKAIQKRLEQSNVTNAHFLGNLKRSVVNEVGPELAYVIPFYYDTPRAVRILGANEESKIAQIDLRGQDIAKYDVICTMGRSYETKNLELLDMMEPALQANPNLINTLGDIYFKMMGADQIAERFKKMLPPQLADAEDGQQPIPPQVQQQLQGSQQMVEQLTQRVHDLTDSIATKREELESRERIANLNAKVELLKTMATLQSKEDMFAMQTEVEHIDRQLAQMGSAMQPEAMDAQDMPELANEGML